MYTLPVNAIKRILMRENDTYFCDRFNWNGDYQSFASELVKRHIDKMQLYDEIETFINQTRKMSLQEWIDTLK